MASHRDPDKAFFGHPAGLSTLFFTEMWERFSYYGMRAFFILYMTAAVDKGGLGWSDGKAGLVLGVYLSSVYLLSLPGGWVADRFLGQRKAVLVGGVGIMLGNALLALPGHALFFPGLALTALGTGLLKPNVSTIVGQLYHPDDSRREAGFTIYYMGINIGALFSPLVCGYLAQSNTFAGFLTDHGIDPGYCWKFAYCAVAIGMLAGIIQYWVGQPRLGKAGLKPTIPADAAKATRDRYVLMAILGVFVLIGIGGYLAQDQLSDILEIAFPIMLMVLALGLFFGLYTGARDAGERARVIAMIPLFIGGIAFFAIFEQASSTLNLFAERNVERELFGLTIPASYYQTVNSVFIIGFAPIVALIWTVLGRKNKEPTSVNKFGIGMLFIACGIAVLLPTLAPESHGERVSGIYLIALYLFYTFSELCISPVGLASMSRLAPERLAGLVMGTWFLAAGIGNFISGQAAGVTAERGHGFLYTFVIIASVVVAAGLFAVAPLIKKMLGAPAPAAPAPPLPKATARMVEPDGDSVESSKRPY